MPLRSPQDAEGVLVELLATEVKPLAVAVKLMVPCLLNDNPLNADTPETLFKTAVPLKVPVVVGLTATTESEIKRPESAVTVLPN